MTRRLDALRRRDRSKRFQLPTITRGARGAVIAAGGLALLGIYFLSAQFHIGEPTLLVASAIDGRIPFLEWTIWVYVSEYPLLILAILLPADGRRRSEAAYGLLLAALIAFVIFTLWPTSILRASPSFVGVTGALWLLLYAVDTTTNAFPSLHVANTCIAARALYGERGFWRLLAPAWAAAIIVSTLTTKQHYFIDVPAGVLVGIVCIAVTRFGFTYRELGRQRVEQAADERST